MQLTNPEKLILIMLCEIQDKLGIPNGTDTKLVSESIYTDNTWALTLALPGIVGDSGDELPPQVREVMDILTMWGDLERSFASLDQTTKTQLVTDFHLSDRGVYFTGFDGNNEGEQLSIASFFIKQLDRWQEFKGRSLNSHCPVLNGYRSMCEAYNRIRSERGFKELAGTDIREILLAERG